jgi:hypothetical protein
MLLYVNQRQMGSHESIERTHVSYDGLHLKATILTFHRDRSSPARIAGISSSMAQFLHLTIVLDKLAQQWTGN